MIDILAYTCERCKLIGFPSIHGQYCTACANHFRFGHMDPKLITNFRDKKGE